MEKPTPKGDRPKAHFYAVRTDTRHEDAPTKQSLVELGALFPTLYLTYERPKRLSATFQNLFAKTRQ